MNSDEQIKLQHELLLNESKHMHDNIQRNLVEMYKLLALGFPVLTGAFALAIEGKILDDPDKGLLYALFSILIGLMVVSFNSIWMQLLTFTRYKYAEILPKLYELVDLKGDNYGQYTARGGIIRTMAGPAIVQLIFLPMVVVATYQGIHQCSHETFSIPAYFSVGFAMLTTVFSWFAAYKTVKVIRIDP